MDDNNELIIYVLQQLRQGVPEPAVRNILAQNGWPQPLIDRAFSMVQQARPHQVNLQNLPPAPVQPQPVQVQQAQPQPVELPKPAADPYPIIEDEKKLEKRSNLRRRAFMATLVVLLLAGIAAAVFFVSQRMNEKPAKENTTKTTSVDEQRKDSIDTLADHLTTYYKAKGTYPTITEINALDFASKNQGLDTTKQHDPTWNDKNTACTDDKGRAIFAASRGEGCFTYRATALNGEDCDAKATKCTRVVITANLEGNKPYISALDRNNKE